MGSTKHQVNSMNLNNAILNSHFFLEKKKISIMDSVDRIAHLQCLQNVSDLL